MIHSTKTTETRGISVKEDYGNGSNPDFNPFFVGRIRETNETLCAASMAIPLKDVESFVTVEKHSSGKFRMRWKKRDLKKGRFHSLITRLGAVGGEPLETYHSTRKAALGTAQAILEAEDALSHAAKKFKQHHRERIFSTAVEIAAKNIDPVEAMRIGSEQIIKERTVSSKTIGSFWPKYYEEKKRDGLNDRRASHWKSLFKLTEHGVMAEPIKTFLDVKKGKQAVVRMFKANPQWKAATTAHRQISDLKLFLEWLYDKPEGAGLSRPILNEIFNRKSIKAALPKFTAKRDPTPATMEQVRNLFEFIGSEEGRGLGGWFVAKFFLGARTQTVCGPNGQKKSRAHESRWRWDMFDLTTGAVSIPKQFTKNKKTIQFDMEKFPNLLAWMKWAHCKDEVTEPTAPLCDLSDSSVSGKLNRWVNKPENKEIWAVKDPATGKKDLRKRIVVGAAHHNFQRSGFITYGLQIARNTEHWTVDDVSRCVDDWESHEHYVEQGTLLEMAKEYFGCRPDNLYAILGS
jgi:hypothetical protein